MAQPGVMIYFDIRPGLRRLSDSDKGKLLDAILDYAERGEEPKLDGMAGLAWDFIKPKIDRDSSKYEEQIYKRKYAVYVREVKKTGAEPLPFDDWMLSSDNTDNHMIPCDSTRYPTTTTSTTTSTTASTTVTDNKADKPPRARFSPPTVEEVEEYCIEKCLSMDARRFVDYYQSNGWMVGKNKMKDWKAAARGWEAREKTQKPNNGGYVHGADRLLNMIRNGEFDD